MTSNFIKHYNDFEKDGDIINLNNVKRFYKRETTTGIYSIIFVFSATTDVSNSTYTEFKFENEEARNSYHKQLVELLILEIDI